MRYLIRFIYVASLLALVVLSGCSAGRKAYSKGENFEKEGKFEEAMYSYADAFRAEPDVGEYRVRFFKARDKASEQRYRKGTEYFDQSNYEAALAEFQAALGLDPTQGRFKQRADSAARLKDAQAAYKEGLDFEKGNKLKDALRSFLRALEIVPESKQYREAFQRVSGQRRSKLEGFELNLKSSKPITLKFKDAKIKDVFAIVTQLSGINFIFDEGVKDQPVTIFLENATFQQTMDLLANMHKLGRKVLNESTVIIYPKSPEKIKQYEDMVLRTFHLNHMEAKKAVNLVRTMLQVRKVYVNEDSNSLVVRDTADIVDVVEKILDANDVPEPEVILDVEVMEISDRNAQNVGLLLSNYNVQLGAFSPEGKLLANSLTSATTTSTSTTTTTTTSASIDNLVRAFTLKGYGGFVTIPSAQYNLGKTLAKGEVLSNPKIRVKNKEKSKFNVGTRVPITTTTLNGTLSQVNVQYVDVGVKVNAEPTILLNNEVSIKLNLEVSSILAKETVGGKDSPTSVVTIGTRNLDTVLSLKDGETSVIGGLIQNTSSDSKQKLVLLGDLPLVGPLLSSNDSSRDKTELILAITPRLVRGLTVPQSALSSFMSGKEDEPSLHRPLGSFELEDQFDAAPKQKLDVSVPATRSPAGSAVKPAAAQAPSVPAAPAPPQPAVPVPGVAKPVMPTTPVPAMPASAPAKRGLLQIAAPASVTLGQQLKLDIKISDAQDLEKAPFVLTYDPAFVEFVSVAEGTFLKGGGSQTSFTGTADPAAGTVTVSLARTAGRGGATGSGVLATAVFRAKNQGPASFGFRNVSLSSSGGRVFEVLPFSTAVDVR